MVLIVGWGGGKAQDLGEIAPVTCPNCNNAVFLHRIRSEKRISLFFVPIAPYGSNEYLACPICRHGLQVEPEQRAAIDDMRTVTALFRRGTIPPDQYSIKVDRFWQKLAVASAGRHAVHPAPTMPQPSAVRTVPPIAAQPIADQLHGLAELHANGVLTDDEFATAKRHVLGRGR